jgi:hypothetical protein
MSFYDPWKAPPCTGWASSHVRKSLGLLWPILNLIRGSVSVGKTLMVLNGGKQLLGLENSVSH